MIATVLAMELFLLLITYDSKNVLLKLNTYKFWLFFSSQDDDDEDKNGDSESHVGKANDFDCFCIFQTVSVLYLDKFFL